MQHGRPAWLTGDIRHLLVFRALQVGDLLCAVPALRALRASFPDARLSLVGLPWAAQFARRFAHYIDDCLVFPGHPSLPEQPADTAAYREFIARLQTLHADLAIQLHGSGECSNPIVRAFGARLNAGFSRRPDIDGPGFIACPTHGQESERLLSLAMTLSARPSDATPEFPLLPDDHAELAATGLLPRLAAAGRPFVCLHPGARDPARRWPLACFAAVGDAFVRRGFAVVLAGSAAEHGLVAALAQQMRQPAIQAALPWSLGAMAALMLHARLVVCNDSGASHIAAGLRVPSVVIFTREDPAHVARWAPLDAARHRRVVDTAGEAVIDVLRAAGC